MRDAARAHAHRRRMWRFGRVFIPVWIALAAIITLMAAADSLWHFGWGYHWRDALFGLGFIAFGLVFWAIWNLMFRALGWFTDILFGSDPNA